MKKLFVLTAIAALAACGGSDPKPADPSTTSSTPGAASATPTPSGSATPAATDATKAADPAKK